MPSGGSNRGYTGPPGETGAGRPWPWQVERPTRKRPWTEARIRNYLRATYRARGVDLVNAEDVLTSLAAAHTARLEFVAAGDVEAILRVDKEILSRGRALGIYPLSRTTRDVESSSQPGRFDAPA